MSLTHSHSLSNCVHFFQDFLHSGFFQKYKPSRSVWQCVWLSQLMVPVNDCRGGAEAKKGLGWGTCTLSSRPPFCLKTVASRRKGWNNRQAAVHVCLDVFLPVLPGDVASRQCPPEFSVSPLGIPECPCLLILHAVLKLLLHLSFLLSEMFKGCQGGTSIFLPQPDSSSAIEIYIIDQGAKGQRLQKSG